MAWLRRLSRDRGSKGEADRPFSRDSQQYDTKHTEFSRQDSQDLPSHQGPMNGGDVQVQSPRDSRQNKSYPPSSFPASLSNHAVNAIVPAPDPLTRVFNEALKPYFDKIDTLESELAGMQNRVAELEEEQHEVFAFIDQHGLRPNVPPSIANIMDRDPEAALLLSRQIEHKANKLDLDLHRLQTSVNDSLPWSHYTTAFLALLPDIDRLTSLQPHGAHLAFDLVVKLGGNLNSFGASDSSTHLSAANEPSIDTFYTRLDEVLIGICHTRLAQDGPDWQVLRDVRRIERAEQNWKARFGLRTAEYFPRSLDLMRYEVNKRAPNGDGDGSGSTVNRPRTTHYEN